MGIGLRSGLEPGLKSDLKSGLAKIILVAGLLVSPPASADMILSPQELLQAINANGAAAINAAMADIDIARAKLDEAGAGLMPKVTLSVTGQFMQSAAHERYPDDKSESYGMLEVVQPLYDFGQSASERDAAGMSLAATEQKAALARNMVLLEGLALYYDLHASELEVRALHEAHTSAYLQWDRAKEKLALGRASEIDVAETLADTEQTRLTFYRERSRNIGYRLRLEELTGLEFNDELIAPPKPPQAKPAEVEREPFLQAVMAGNEDIQALSKQADAAGLRRDGVGAWPSLDAFANTGYSTRNLRGRNDYAVGARLSWPLFDGGVTSAKKTLLAAEQSRILTLLEVRKNAVRQKALSLLRDRDDAYQRILAALAQQDFTYKYMIQRQQLYTQERVADLGHAMIEHTASEAELVRATGAYTMVLANIAVLLGEGPERGLDPDLLARFVSAEDGGDFVPKPGTGFGQSDEDEFKRQDEVPIPSAPESVPVPAVEEVPLQ